MAKPDNTETTLSLSELTKLARTILAQVRALRAGQIAILYNLGVEIMTIDDLKTQVQANTDAEDSASVLLTNLAAIIKSQASDPAKIQALSDQLKQHADSLAAAVVANTPADTSGGTGPTGP